MENRRVFMSDQIRILHLSDLVGKAGDIDDAAALEDLKNLVIEKVGANSIDYIVVCGNIAASAPPRFDRAKEVLERLSSDLLVNDSCGVNRLVVVPGLRDVTDNHSEDHSNYTEFKAFYNDLFAKHITSGELPPFKGPEYALCRELKDLRFIGVSFWPSHSRAVRQQLLECLEKAVRDAETQISRSPFAKARPTLLVSAGTPLLSWDQHANTFLPMEELRGVFTGPLNVSLHLFGSGQVAGILPEPFLFDQVSLGTGTRDDMGFWPLNANLISLSPDLYRSRKAGDHEEAFLLSVVALRKSGPGKAAIADGRQICGHLDLFIRPSEKPCSSGSALYTAFLKTLARLIFKDGNVFVILSGLPGSGKSDFINYLKASSMWDGYNIRAELIELRGMHYDAKAFKKDLRQARANLKERAGENPKRILMIRDQVFAKLSNQEKNTVRTIWPAIEQLDDFDAVIYAMPTVDYVLSYNPLPGKTQRVPFPALDAEGMSTLLNEYEPRFPVANELKNVAGQYAGFSRMLLDAAADEFQKLPGAETIRSSLAPDLLAKALDSAQLKHESEWYLSAIRGMAGGPELCDFLVNTVSSQSGEAVGKPIRFDPEALRLQVRDPNERAALDSTLEDLREMGVLDRDGTQYRICVPAPFIAAGRNVRAHAPLRTKSSLVNGGSKVRPGVDFLIIAPLSEERDALLRRLPDHRRVDPSNDFVHAAYAATLKATLPGGAPGQYQVIVLPLLSMGTNEAASATALALKRWKVRFVILAGIAGGGQAAAPGDLLIADQIVDYTVQKTRTHDPEPRYRVFGTDRALWSAAMAFADPNLDALTRPEPGKTRVLYGPVASGNNVVAGGDEFTRMLGSWPKLIGVEMEAAGVAAAVSESTDHPGFFMVRGVSDNADARKDSPAVVSWREYACDVAATYLIGLLSRGPITFSQLDEIGAGLGRPDRTPVVAEHAMAAAAPPAPAVDLYQELVDFLVRSGKAAENARRALCIRIGVKDSQLSFLTGTSSEDFALQLVDHLRETGDNATLRKLCASLLEILKGAFAERVKTIQQELPS
jgi:nucleoside phosphorylase